MNDSVCHHAHLFELERKKSSFHGPILSSSTELCSGNYTVCANWVLRLKCLLTSVNNHPCKPQCRSMTCTNFRITPSSLMKHWTATINWHILVLVLCKWSKVLALLPLTYKPSLLGCRGFRDLIDLKTLAMIK